MTEKEIKLYAGIIERTNSKWLEFEFNDFTGKTFNFRVWTKDKTFRLGEIKWYGAWRRYAFLPTKDSIFEWDCMRTISDICEKMTKDHNNKYEKLADLRGNVDFRLAVKIHHLQEALNIANNNARKDGKLGVIPDNGGPSFRESKEFYKKIKEIIESLNEKE